MLNRKWEGCDSSLGVDDEKAIPFYGGAFRSRLLDLDDVSNTILVRCSVGQEVVRLFVSIDEHDEGGVRLEAHERRHHVVFLAFSVGDTLLSVLCVGVLLAGVDGHNEGDDYLVSKSKLVILDSEDGDDFFVFLEPEGLDQILGLGGTTVPLTTL